MRNLGVFDWVLLLSSGYFVYKKSQKAGWVKNNQGTIAQPLTGWDWFVFGSSAFVVIQKADKAGVI